MPVLLEAFVCSVWCGATRFVHTEQTRHDPALAGIFGWKNVPAQDAYKRFFGKFSQSDNLRVADHFFRWQIGHCRNDNLTVDFASSVLTRYGGQEGAKRGYNAQKPGRPSHHPLLAFVNACGSWRTSGCAAGTRRRRAISSLFWRRRWRISKGKR